MRVFYLFLISVFSFQWTLAQNITFNDSNFKQDLIDKGVDQGDGVISMSDAEAITSLIVDNKGISDMTEIKYFINLEVLFCSDNSLTSLDVSGLDNLEVLLCSNNSLTSLDVSGLDNLEVLFCSDNSLTSLDVSGLDNLVELYCTDNSLTSLDVSGLDNLVELYCYSNFLTSLDIRNTAALSYVEAKGNPDLECIVVYDVNDVPNTVLVDQSPIPYTTEPCVIVDFEDLEDVINGVGVSPLLAAVLATTALVAEENCTQGNKSAAIYTLKSLKLMIRRARQVNRITASQKDDLIEAVNMLMDNIRSGEVDCSSGEPKNILDWINIWFGNYTLERPAQASTSGTYVPAAATSTVQSVYPNPTSGRVNFAQPDQQVIVYNMLGKMMETAQGADHVDLSTYQPGVYVIQLIKGEERSMHQVVKR